MIARPRVEAPPETWEIVCRHLGLAPTLARRWWLALQASPAACCVNTRQTVLLADTGSALVTPIDLLVKHLAPHRLILCIEDACEHGQLGRRAASHIQETILYRTTATGVWRLTS